MKRRMSWGFLPALMLVFGMATGVHAAGFSIEDVPSGAVIAADTLKPRTIAFSDHPADGLADNGTGLVLFENWARERPLQKRLLSLYPGYIEPTIAVTANGLTKRYTEKLHMYVARARFVIDRRADAIDLNRFTKMDFLQKVDRSIQHRPITADQAVPNIDPEAAYNRRPDRPWCSESGSLCVESRYDLEGKLPIGIRLANKIQDGGKKIAEFLQFQSELRRLSPQDPDFAELDELTGLPTPVAGAVEQSVFHVNQVMQFGKLLAVLQAHPADPGKTVATVFLALGVETDVLDRKKEFESVPVLRNLVPAQVLMGNSSFNTGHSISAGLPAYARNRIIALANLLEEN